MCKPCVPDNAGRERVKAMAVEVLAADDLSDDEQEELEAAWVQYRESDSFPDWALDPKPPDDGKASKKAAWYCSAAQLTYNSTAGDWASTDAGVRRGPVEVRPRRVKVKEALCNPHVFEWGRGR